MQKRVSLVFLWIYLISAWCELQQKSEDTKTVVPETERKNIEKRVFCNAFSGCGYIRPKRSQRPGSSRNSFNVKRSLSDSHSLFSSIFDSNYSPSLRRRRKENDEIVMSNLKNWPTERWVEMRKNPMLYFKR